ncbi:MAG: tRNA guanosine(34) transglycosylase Tgt [Microthrixaceae bacterium]
MIAEFTLRARDGAARTGSVRLARGEVTTPAFMPVATRGTVRALPTHVLAGLRTGDGAGFDVLLSNTYHLMLRPGAAVVAELGGLHAFTGWDGPMLTDSGGYQVFSLEPRVTDEGAEFASTYDGSRHLLTPELAVEVQELLGADVQMVLDVCPPLPSDRATLERAVDTTESWARRALRARRRTDDQSLFGIVQGGVDVDLRARAADRTVALEFDGYALGGLSVGESRAEMLPAIEAAVAELPEDRPRYLMGVGDPVSIVEAVARGIDMFDCVLPTRLARHGTLLTDLGRLNISRAEFARDTAPIQAGCGCPSCAHYERGLLRHLAVVDEPAAATICTIHNLWWMLRLTERIRTAIRSGTLAALRDEVASVWDPPTPA